VSDQSQDIWRVIFGSESSFGIQYVTLFSYFQYIIPITVILFTHTKIIGIVRQRTTRTTVLTGSARAEVTMRRNKKTTQILLIIAAAFGVHWLPFHIYTIGKNNCDNKNFGATSFSWIQFSHKHLLDSQKNFPISNFFTYEKGVGVRFNLLGLDYDRLKLIMKLLTNLS